MRGNALLVADIKVKERAEERRAKEEKKRRPAAACKHSFI